MAEKSSDQPGFKALNYWLTHLPFADHFKAADIVYKVLANLREQQLPQARWLALLDRFDSAIDTVVLAARMEIYHLPLSLADKHQRSQSIDKLQLELAYSYTDVLERVLAGTRLPLPLIANAAFRALYHFAETQKWFYQLYTPVPKGLWLAVNQVYSLATQLKITSYPFAVGNSNDRCVTLENMYKQLLLLAAANTSRMQDLEIDVVSQCLSAWVAQAELEKWQGSPGVYLFDLQTDKGPLWFGDRKLSLASQQIHSLDLSKVNLELMRLSHILSRIPNGELELDGKVMTHRLVQRLLQAWHNKPPRQHSRSKQKGAIKLFYSLSPPLRAMEGPNGPMASSPR